MDKKERFWFSGLWALPFGVVISVGYAFLVNGFRNLLRFDEPQAFSLQPSDYGVMIQICIATILIVFAKNVLGYLKGDRDFRPSLRTDPTKKSKEKLRAMNPQVEKKYITREPMIGTVGKAGGKYVTIPFDLWNVQHTLILGGPGSKKTSTIATTLLKLAESSRHRMTVFCTDIKPEIARRFSRMDKIHAVNFATVNGANFGWDMYYGLSASSTDDQIIKRMRMIADCLIINKDTDSKNAHFIDNAKNIFAAYLYGTYRVLNLGFIDAIRKLEMVDLEQNIQQLTETNSTAASAFKLKEMLGIYSGKKSEGFEDIKTTLTTNLYCFSMDSVRYALRDNPHKASPEDLTKQDPVSVYLCVPDGDLQTLAPLYTCCIEMTLRHLLDIPESERADGDVMPIWLLLDEVGNLPKIPSLERACALLRSRRCFCWLITQSLKQLSNTYGENKMSAIVEDCETLMVLSAKEKDTCRQIQEWCGQYREPKHSVSSKVGLSKEVNTSEGEEFRNIYDVSDIRSLRSQNAMLIFTDGAWFRAEKYTYRDDPTLLQTSERLMIMNDHFLANGINSEDV